jgi:hypothetical protein
MVILYTATLITAKGVIPAPHQVRDKLQRESSLLPMRASLRGMSPSGAEPGPEGKSLDSSVSSTGQA